jgi:hypothetical protein
VPRREAGHLDRDDRGVLADVVPPGPLGAGEGLRLVLGGEDAEGHGNTGGELHLLDAGRGLPRDQVVVRRLATDHAAEADHRVDPPRCGQDARAHGQLEAAGHGLVDHVRRIDAETGQAPTDALGEPVDDG